MNPTLKSIAKALKKEQNNIPEKYWWYISGKIVGQLQKDNPEICFDKFEIKCGRALL